ncbi:MAG: lysostaphin resistance A-like protein [Pseudomonas sp.]
MQVTSQVVRRNSLLFAVGSPIFLVATCAFVQVVAGRLMGVWAWVPTMLFFWAAIAVVTQRFCGSVAALARFRPSAGSFAWPVLATLAGLLSLHGFIGHWPLLGNWQLVAAWLVFALFNPWFEESYWRGLLIDATVSWGKLPSLLYSSIWFAVSHPLIWGIHSLPLRKAEAVGALLFVGLVWGSTYQRTGSLRWCVAGHMLANLFGLAALVLLNLYDPTVR